MSESNNRGVWELLFDVFYLHIFINAATGLFFLLTIIYVNPFIVQNFFGECSNVCKDNTSLFGFPDFLFNINRISSYFFKHGNFLTSLFAIIILIILGELASVLGNYLTDIIFRPDEDKKGGSLDKNKSDIENNVNNFEKIDPQYKLPLKYEHFVKSMGNSAFKHSEIYYNMFRVLSGVAWMLLVLIYNILFLYSGIITPSNTRNIISYCNSKYSSIICVVFFLIFLILYYKNYFKYEDKENKKDLIFFLASLFSALFFALNIYFAFFVILFFMVLDYSIIQRSHANKVVYFQNKNIMNP